VTGFAALVLLLSVSTLEAKTANGVSLYSDMDTIPEDFKGLGSHVAGTVAGQNYWAAKNAIILPHKALGCDGKGYCSDLITAVGWVRDNHQISSVVNISLGGPFSSVMDSVFKAGNNTGITVSVAAVIDSGQSACYSSPAAVPNANTVASITITDSRLRFSNVGTCVDLSTPGSAITLTWYNSDQKSNKGNTYL
jgi:subtilisin family serine protease